VRWQLRRAAPTPEIRESWLPQFAWKFGALDSPVSSSACSF
jgi:hypothetical protein